MKLKDARHLSSSAQEALRYRVVNAVENGMSKSEAARVFKVSRTAIHHWTKATATEGASVSVWTVGRYLKKWGFTPQKPLRRAYEQDPKAVQQWLETEYPQICRDAHRQKGEIHWGDEMGVRSDYQAGRSYGRAGQTPVVRATGQRFGCNIISTITNRGKLCFKVFTQRFDATVMLNFLRRLIRHRPHKVFLIVDSHPVHRSRAVRQWVERHADRIRLFFLPAYSPQLNPDELLNHDLKTNAVGRQRPKNQAEMIGNIRSYLRSTQRHPQVVQNFFHEKHVTYAAV